MNVLWIHRSSRVRTFLRTVQASTTGGKPVARWFTRSFASSTDDAAMGVVEGQVRRQEVRLGRVEFSATTTDVEYQIHDMEYGFKDPFRLAVEEFADECSLAKETAIATAAMVG